MNNGIMILLIFAIIILAPLLCVYLVYRISKHNRAEKNKRCTMETQGEIVKLKLKSGDGPFVITVRYEVDFTNYMIKESVKLKSTAIKAGKIPIGQKKTPVIGEIKEGTSVTVRYNPNNPEEAFVKGNEGFITG